MTFDLALNRKDRDLVFSANANGFATLLPIDGADRILQKIVITLNMWLKDWFLDQRLGVPYVETIFVKQTRKSTIESIIRTQIMSVVGVRQILDFSLATDPATRLLTINFVADTVEGTVKGSATLDKSR